MKIFSYDLKREGKMKKALKIQGFFQAPEGARTPDLRITNASLYQLSHGSNLQQIILYCVLTILTSFICGISDFSIEHFLHKENRGTILNEGLPCCIIFYCSPASDGPDCKGGNRY